MLYLIKKKYNENEVKYIDFKKKIELKKMTK